MRSLKPHLAAAAAGIALLLVPVAGATDPKADAVLKQAYKTLHAAKSYTANLSIQAEDAPGGGDLKGTIAAMKPNLLRVEVKLPAGGGNLIFASDGKHQYVYSPEAKRYQKSPVERNPTAFVGVWEGEVDAFFGGEKLLANTETTYVGSEKVDGVDCDVVRLKPKGQGATVAYAVGKKDHLIRRAAIAVPTDDGARRQTNSLTQIKLNPPKTAADFAFKPPADAVEQPAGQ
jgi:outer membrane lipoprotein-sorting protein